MRFKLMQKIAQGHWLIFKYLASFPVNMAQGYQRPVITPDVSVKSPQYQQFVLDLQRCWDLTGAQPQNLVWVSRHPNNHFYDSPRDTRVSFRQFDDQADPLVYDERPDLAIVTFASYNGKRQGPEYSAPLMVEERGSKELGSTNLPNYEIKWNADGRLIDPPVSLEKILKDEMKVTGDKTPVLEVVAFMPVSKEPSGYETHFLPQLTGTDRYGYFAIVEDRMPRGGYMGSTIRIHDNGEAGEYKSFRLSFVPDMSALEKSMLPSHHGHMLIIGKGIKIKRKGPEPLYEPDYAPGWGLKSLGGSSRRGSDYVPRTQIGDTSIGSGTETGDRFQKVEAEDDLTRQPVIFHVKTIGVRRLEEGGLSEAMIKQLFDTVNSFPILN